MYRICFYVPDSHLENVKNALFTAGAGKIGPYDCCAWQCLGESQFRPLADSNAYIGEVGEVEKISEYKVEMVCEDNILTQVIQALKDSHPYEMPAYSVWRVENM